MFPTLVGGVIALIVAIGFLGILLTSVTSVALWTVVLGGIVLMVVSVVEAVRGGKDQFGS